MDTISNTEMLGIWQHTNCKGDDIMKSFTYVGSRYGKRCAFCKTSLSVKYIVTLNSNFPADSIVSDTKVYACHICVAKRIGGNK